MAAQIKVEHINPFIQATAQTFATMVKCEIKPGKMQLRTGDTMHHDVSGIIGLSGGAKGSVALSFPRITALKVVSAFIGDKVLQLDKDALDAVGELANIVAGSAKQDLSQYKIMISLPTVITGNNHTLNSPSDAPELIVPFETPHGKFDLLVCFKSEA
jgi:chemotaxis protein CheX